MKIRIGAGNAAYASATVYRRAVRNLKAPPRAPYPPQRWNRSNWICAISGRRAGLLQSPLTDSNRRPPPYHFVVRATSGKRGQRIRLV